MLRAGDMGEERYFSRSKLVHEAGQVTPAGNMSLRQRPPPAKSAACAGRQGSLDTAAQRKRRARCGPSSARKESTSGWCPQIRTSLSGETPACVRASATDKKDDPLNPGPSSTTRKIAFEA